MTDKFKNLNEYVSHLHSLDQYHFVGTVSYVLETGDILCKETNSERN